MGDVIKSYNFYFYEKVAYLFIGLKSNML